MRTHLCWCSLLLLLLVLLLLHLVHLVPSKAHIRDVLVVVEQVDVVYPSSVFLFLLLRFCLLNLWEVSSAESFWRLGLGRCEISWRRTHGSVLISCGWSGGSYYSSLSSRISIRMKQVYYRIPCREIYFRVTLNDYPLPFYMKPSSVVQTFDENLATDGKYDHVRRRKTTNPFSDIQTLDM